MSYYEYGKTERYLLSLLPHSVMPELEDVREDADRLGVPVISETGAQLLRVATMRAAPSRILEIGTGTGYSGLVMLQSSRAKLYTIDFDSEAVERARVNFRAHGCARRVEIFEGDASEVIPMIEGKFGMIFLDGPKGRYYEFLPYLINLLTRGGVLLCDNVLYSGRMSGVKDVPPKKRTIYERLELFMKAVNSDPRLVTSVLPVGDGMSLSVKVSE